jgi:ankyrin repeat protein
MNLHPPPPPPQDDDPIITQFKPVADQWGLNDENITLIDPETGQTILHNYCQHINTTPLEVYQYLIETKRCDVNAQDEDEYTPFHDALYYFDPRNGGDITALTYLINQKGVNGNTKDRNGNTLLHRACEKINRLPLDIYKTLIEKHGCDVNVQDNNKDIPLHNAIYYFNPNDGGDITVLTYLLTQTNLDVNIKGQRGYTILHEACKKINRLPLDVFKLLIETVGCDVNAQDDNNRYTPLHNALDQFNPNDGGNITVLTYLLTQTNLDVNMKGKRGYTILHWACEKINRLPLEMMKLLIETNGSDVNAQDNCNDTPIHRALLYFDPRNGGDSTMLTYLLTQRGINGNIKGQFDRTLLHYACININRIPLDVFKVLIETHGADVNAQDKDNHTPLHNAIYCFNSSQGDINVLAYLINQTKTGVNTKYTKGCTLFHSACTINLSNKRYSMRENAEYDAISCQIVELIAERCTQEVLEETTS